LTFWYPDKISKRSSLRLGLIFVGNWKTQVVFLKTEENEGATLYQEEFFQKGKGYDFEQDFAQPQINQHQSRIYGN